VIRSRPDRNEESSPPSSLHSHLVVIGPPVSARLKGLTHLPKKLLLSSGAPMSHHSRAAGNPSRSGQQGYWSAGTPAVKAPGAPGSQTRSPSLVAASSRDAFWWSIRTERRPGQRRGNPGADIAPISRARHVWPPRRSRAGIVARALRSPRQLLSYSHAHGRGSDCHWAAYSPPRTVEMKCLGGVTPDVAEEAPVSGP